MGKYLQSTRYPFCSICRGHHTQSEWIGIKYIMHNCEKSLRGHIERTWRELDSACENALELSHKVGKHLKNGASTSELVPLLRRELELARNIKGGIHRLATADGVTLPPTYQKRLTPRIESLIYQQEQNRSLLTQRGVRISG